VLLCLLLAWLLIYAKVSLLDGGVLNLANGLIAQNSKRQLASNSERSTVYSQAGLEALQKTLGAFLMSFDVGQQFYLQIYGKVNRKLWELMVTCWNCKGSL